MNKADEPKTVEQRLAEWAAQDPAVCRVSPQEWAFIDRVRQAAAAGVGYGWMQQAIEWEWQSKGPGAWGPESHQRELQSARKDERRYQFLRSSGDLDCPHVYGPDDDCIIDGDELDAAIDRALGDEGRISPPHESQG